MATEEISESRGSHVIFPSEAELHIQSLRTFHLEDIGDIQWSKQHEVVEKLNMQAIMNASQQSDEFVKEFLVTYQKVPILIHSLILTEVWKENVFPVVLKKAHKPKTTFPCYIVLYHEATLVNLLETTLFYQETTESAEDSALDLVDYCHRKIVRLITRQQDKDEESDSSNDEEDASVKELKRQFEDMEFQLSIRCLSIVRYLVDHMESVPLSVATRILNKHDFPSLYTTLLEDPPWTRRSDKGYMEKYVEGKWKVIPGEEKFQLTKTEAQVWLAVYQMLLNPYAQQKYEFNPANKNQILKIRAHLVEPYVDQIPNLADLQRYLEHLAIIDPPPPKPSVILEQVPEIYNGLHLKYRGRWEKVASEQMQRLFSPSDAALKEQAKRWVDTYNFDVLDSLITEPPKCALCGQLATKRCSRCRIEWYCGRECQVKHWSKHKQTCDTLVSAQT
jgi:hypothetical protein